jgi:hypothetical protein
MSLDLGDFFRRSDRVKALRHPKIQSSMGPLGVLVALVGGKEPVEMSPAEHEGQIEYLVAHGPHGTLGVLAGSQSRFHLYDLTPPTTDVGTLLEEIDRDPTAIFWG